MVVVPLKSASGCWFWRPFLVAKFWGFFFNKKLFGELLSPTHSTVCISAYCQIVPFYEFFGIVAVSRPMQFVNKRKICIK